MTDSGSDQSKRSPRMVFRPGTYLRCGSCGRLLRIEWRTRSIVCSCGARITPPQDGPEQK
jgi:hypothetical protein